MQETVPPCGGAPRPIEVLRYAPPARTATVGVFVVLPGLHFLGPADHRLDRFCRILAAAGHEVVAPFLPDYAALRITRDTIADARLVVQHAAARAAARGWPRPAIFSISFGSLPALGVAADRVGREHVGALVLFGGYCDFSTALRFSLTGRAPTADDASPVDLPHDPLNAPAAFINLLPHFGPAVVDDPRALADAWRDMARRTWGHPHLRPLAHRRAIAAVVGANLSPRDRSLFEDGCGLRPERLPAWLDRGVVWAGDAMAFAEGAPLARAVTAPVVVCHGRDDDVIPHHEATRLYRALGGPRRRHRLFITGLYAHTGAAPLASAAAIGRELATLRGLVFALVDAATEGHPHF
ncbi:MAG: hypothetical protein AAF928_02115 [Myxococcota bacterium]